MPGWVTCVWHFMRVAGGLHCLKKGTNLGRDKEHLPCVEETEGRHSSLQLPHEGQQRGRHWSVMRRPEGVA